MAYHANPDTVQESEGITNRERSVRKLTIAGRKAYARYLELVHSIPNPVFAVEHSDSSPEEIAAELILVSSRILSSYAQTIHVYPRVYAAAGGGLDHIDSTSIDLTLNGRRSRRTEAEVIEDPELAAQVESDVEILRRNIEGEITINRSLTVVRQVARVVIDHFSFSSDFSDASDDLARALEKRVTDVFQSLVKVSVSSRDGQELTDTGELTGAANGNKTDLDHLLESYDSNTVLTALTAGLEYLRTLSDISRDETDQYVSDVISNHLVLIYSRLTLIQMQLESEGDFEFMES